jgi:hypothetical protein
MRQTLSRVSWKRTAGRLEATHAFLDNDPPEARPDCRLFHEVHVAAEQRGQVLAESFQPAEVVATRSEAGAGVDCKIDIGCAARLAAGKRPEQRDPLDPECPQV